MKNRTYAASLAGTGLLCLAATGAVFAQAGPSDSGQAARAGTGNQVTNPSQGIPEGEPGDTQPVPQDESDAMQQAYKDYSAKKFAVATPELLAIVKKSPNIVEAHEMLSSIYITQNQVPQAIPELEAVVRLQPKNSSFRNNLGVAYLNAGQPEKAAAEFQTLIAQKPADTSYVFSYAKALEEDGKSTDAAAALEKAAALDPKDSLIPLNIGILYHQSGNDTKAVPALKSALALGTPHKFEANIALAEAADKAKQSSDAIGYYTQAVQAKPDDFGAQANLGILQQNAGMKADAEATYQKALAAKTDDPKAKAEVQENLAILLNSDGKLDDAAALLVQAAAVNTTSVAIQDRLGGIYEKQGKKDLALAAYKQALTINSDNGLAKEGVARLSK